MRWIKNRLGLSDEGYRDFKRGVFACVLSNLSLLLPFFIIIQIIITLLDPLLSPSPGGAAVDGATVGSAAVGAMAADGITLGGAASNGATVDTGRLWLWLIAGIAAALLYCLVYLNEYRKTYTAAYSESEKIRLEVAERLRRLPLSFFNKKDLSELTTNIMGDCSSIEHTMSHVVPGLFGDTITIVIACVMLALYDWRMSLALFAALPISLGLILLTRGIQTRFGERHVQAKLDVTEQVQEYLEGVKVVKAFGLAGEKSQALEQALRRMMKEAVRFEGVSGIFVTLAMMIMQVGIGLVTLVGVMLFAGGALDPIKLLAFIVISAKIYSPLIVVFTLLPEFFYMLVSTRRMQELRKEPVMDGDEQVELDAFDVELRHVSFAYHGTDVIHDVCLRIPQNGVTAFVGPSGSGKTTITRLIARFWDAREGEILIGGRDIRGIDPERLMGYMSFVFQDVVLFNDTVMNNIRIGKRDATDAEVFAAARMARCDEFIRALPQGYDTLIGENGSTLSGGERQRISIARALLKNAPIVLLDEATASLDPENETQIQAAISTLIEGRTVIVIAHRLRTVIGADTIAVLDGGRLVEQGTSAELLARDGLFARLYAIQQASLGWTVH